MSKALLVGNNENLEIYKIETEPYGTNAYLVTCKSTKKTLLIDAPGSKKVILEMLSRFQLVTIIITHGHADHLVILNDLHDLLQVPIAAHEKEVSTLPLTPEIKLQDGDIVPCGNIELEVIHTPGHTRGSICLKVDKYLLAGDTIFPGGPGKTWTATDFKTIIASIEKRILTLPEETVILPGHGVETNIKNEQKLFNAFISRYGGEDYFGDITWS